MSTLRRILHAHLASRISQAIMRVRRAESSTSFIRLGPFRDDYISRSLIRRYKLSLRVQELIAEARGRIFLRRTERKVFSICDYNHMVK